MLRRLAGLVGAALLFLVPAIALINRVGQSWEARVAVRGHSMEPTLREGDWLLVDPDAFVRRAPRVGELVVARDPREPVRAVVKRVTAFAEDGRVLVAGDHPAHVDEQETIGSVPRSALLGRPWFRYWPTDRFGRIS